jgi:hypothetical protein
MKVGGGLASPDHIKRTYYILVLRYTFCPCKKHHIANMPRIEVSGVDAASRKKFPREFSLLSQLGGEAVDSEVCQCQRAGQFS